MANEPKELIELFLIGGVGTGGENFETKFQALLGGVPRIHSTLQPKFFTYFFLGSVLTLPCIKLNDEIGVKSSCVKILQGEETIKLAFKIEKNKKTKLVFRNIATVKDIRRTQHLDINEFKEALRSLDLAQEELSNCEVKGEIVHIKDGKLNIVELKVVDSESLKAETLKQTINNHYDSLLGVSEEEAQFKKVKDNAARNNFGDSLAKINDIKTAEEGTKEFFKDLAEVYRSEKALPGLNDIEVKRRMKLSDSEAAYHGFVYGVLAMNFKYKYALDINVERIAGRGYVDLMFISRCDKKSQNKKWNAPPIIVELKGGKKTAENAISQIKNQGYTKNLPSMRTIAREGMEVGLNFNLDPSQNGLSVKGSDVIIKPKRVIELIEIASLSKDEIKAKIGHFYYSIVDSNGGGKNTNYLSRLILGELLADNTPEKRVFIYKGNHIKPGSAEHNTRSGGVSRDVSTEISKMVSTFLFKKQDGKYVILNVVEAKDFEVNKGIQLPKGVDSSQCARVNIKVNQEARGGFEVGNDKEKSYFRGVEIINTPQFFQDEYVGKFEEIRHVDILNSGNKVQVEDLKKALFPLKELITLENHFQAVLQGLFTAQETSENVRVFTEPNYSREGKPDLVVSRIEEVNDGGCREKKLIVMELKHNKNQAGAERGLAQGVEKIKKYEINLKTFTDLDQGEKYVLVFNFNAKSPDELLLKMAEDMDIIHSSQESENDPVGVQPPKKKQKTSGNPSQEEPLSGYEFKAGCSNWKGRRSIGMTCIDSRDEEKEGKEELIRELFDSDKIREIKENFEFYDQLFRVSDQIAKGETIDPSIEENLREKFKNIDLDSIDPEIKDIVREIEEKISQEKVNKEEIKAILTRSGAAEKIGKIAEGAGHALAIFFVAEHMIKGDIEGLGYDALNLFILPKIGEKASGELLELGAKYDSQALKGFAPVAGNVMGNFLAFVGLGESIKALQGATDPIDVKFAKLNIITNSLFIATDIPAIVTGIMSSAGVSVGIVGEFAGPVGAVVSVAVIIVSQLKEAELKVEKVEELIKLTDKERTQLYWRFFFGIRMPEYIEADMEAKKIYENYISEIIDKFKDDFDMMAISLPKIALEEKKYIDIKDTHIAIIEEGGPRKTCKIQANITKFELDFPSGVVVDLRNISDAGNYSRVVPEKIEGYRILCGPTDRDVQVELLSKQEYKDPSFELCSDYFKNSKEGNNGIMIQEQKKWSLDTYSTNCNNAVVYNNKSSNKYRSIYYIKSKEAKIRTYGDSNIAVVFDGNSISVDSTERKGGASHSTESRQPLKKCEAHIPKNIFDAENGCDSSQESIFSKGNHYYFLQPLSSCKINKPDTNFFYVKGDNFSCKLGKERQTNIVMIQGYFTDLSNKSIQTIIGSNTTDSIKVFHADYVDGKGGNDVIKAKNSTTIMGNFGDDIYGKGVTVLPIVFSEIDKMILEGDKNTIYSKDGNLTIHGKEMLMKTRDGFFVTPTKTDNRTKMVTNFHVANYNKTEVSETLKACHDSVSCSEQLIILSFGELYLKENFENAGFHFMRKLFGDTHIHKDTSGYFFMDSTPVIIMSALQGKLMGNSNFNVTKQMFTNDLDVVIGDSDHHVFYADRQSHFFYWEGAENVPNLYLFDDKNVTVVINKGNGLLDFSMVKSEEKYKVEVEEDAVFIVKGNVRAVLPMNYKNITVTFDQKEYYKLQGGKLERDYCSHSLKIDERFRVNSTDLLNYNCLTFDTDKVFFLRLGNDLQLVSNKGALSILDYYKPDSDAPCMNVLYMMGMEECADSLDLSIKLSNRIIKPEEFRKRANNPSVFRYYQLGEEGLEIYHNQPTNNHQIGLMDLKDKSILDCSVRITSGNLILSFKNTAIVQVKNWNIYQPAREMMFIFNDTVISNAKCVVSNCDPKDAMVEFNKEKIILQIFYAIKQNNIDAKDKDGKTLFHIVAKEGDLGSAMLLVDKIESINFERSLYAEPDELVRAVLQRERLKSLINTKDKFGYTPLQYAAKEGKWDIVNLFLDKTAERNPDDVTSKNQFSVSWTTVHYAVYNGNLNLIKDIFQFLSDKGTIVNTKDSSGWAPLHYAVLYDASDMVKFLVDEGASVEIEDIDGKTPLKLARESDKPEIVSYLEGKLNEEKGKPAQRKRRHHHGDRSRYHNRGQKQLQEEERPNLESIDVSDRHSIRKEDKKEGTHRIRHKRHEQHHRGHLQERKQGGATSGASKPFSLINEGISLVEELLTNTYLATKRVAVEGFGSVNRLAGSIYDRILGVEEIDTVNEKTIKANEETTKYKLEFRKDIPNLTSNTPYNSADQANGNDQKQSGKHAYNYFTSEDFSRDNINYIDANLKRARERQMPGAFKLDGKETTAETIFKMGEHYLSQVDNGMITFLDFLIRRITGQKHISTQVKDISEQEARIYAFEITQECKKIVEQAASKSGISMHRLNIDFMEIRKEITGKIMSDKFNEIPGTLNSYVEKACPGKEAGCPGKLNLKGFNKFITEFNKELDVALNQPMQQVLSRNSTLKASNVKKRQISLEHRSYLNNTSVQGHLTRLCEQNFVMKK